MHLTHIPGSDFHAVGDDDEDEVALKRGKEVDSSATRRPPDTFVYRRLPNEKSPLYECVVPDIREDKSRFTGRK